jgi:hypothetical protein
VGIAKTYRVSWQGIALSVTHTPDRFGQVDHVEVQSDGRAPLPITGTGYKSMWLCPEDLAGYASSAAFVLAWLDLCAAENGWQGAQLSLF